jgi:hypothetical protein
MIGRRSFVASALALIGGAAPARALAFVETPSASGRTSEDGRLTLEATAVVVAALQLVRTVWRPPSVFPGFAPIAYYPGAGADPSYPNEPVIWLNPDHPELVSPRISRLTDEIPLFTELFLASVDLRLRDAPQLGLDALTGEKRRLAATALADRVAVIGKYTPYVAVDDAEFARRSFAFAVLRQMTPRIDGVAPFAATRPLPPGEAAVYAGRDADPRAPRGWGVIYADFAAMARDQAGYESWVRAFVLATADRQPPESEQKRAYDAARAKDEAANGDRWAARRGFAAPYVRQVAALFGR